MVREIKDLLEYCSKEELEQIKDFIIVTLDRIDERNRLRRKLYPKCEECNEGGEHSNMCPNNLVNSDAYQYRVDQM